MITNIRRWNEQDNPYEAWSFELDNTEYCYYTHPPDDLKITTEICTTDNNAMYHSWILTDEYLTLTGLSPERQAARILLVFAKATRQLPEWAPTI